MKHHTTKVSEREEVNKRCPAKNTTTPYTDPERHYHAQRRRQTGR